VRNTFVTEDNWDHQNFEEQDQKKMSEFRDALCDVYSTVIQMYPWVAKNTWQDSPSVLAKSLE